MNKTNKFNPEEVPSWCRWLAVDKNGKCWAYSGRPLSNERVFEDEWWPKSLVGKQKLLYHGKPPKNWKDELYTWG